MLLSFRYIRGITNVNHSKGHKNTMTTTTKQATKFITCPECGSAAKLYVEPSMWAGIWSCTNIDCGASDNCEHTNNHLEAIEVDILVNGEPASFPAMVSTCDDCGSQHEPSNEAYGDDGDDE